jgi:hypothetical protein
MNAFKILGIVGIAASLAFTSYRGDVDPLKKRKFSCMASEIKDGKPSGKKPVADEIEFTKKGAVYSSFVWEKMEFQDVKYEVEKDSTFNEGGEELHYLQVKAVTTNDKKETLEMSFTINGYDIEGTYKLIKKDVVKKWFTTTGKEKLKEKKKKDKEE